MSSSGRGDNDDDEDQGLGEARRRRGNTFVPQSTPKTSSSPLSLAGPLIQKCAPSPLGLGAARCQGLARGPASYAAMAWDFAVVSISKGARAFLLGGLAMAAKLSAVLLSRIVWPPSWPCLQAATLSSFLLWKSCILGKGKIINCTKAIVAPLQSLSGTVLCVAVAQPVLKWLNPDAFRTLCFWQRLLPIYAGYMKTKLQIRNKSSEERDTIWAKRHEWGGEKVYKLILDMSGFYVKSAQILASKTDFVPEGWTKYLSRLLDNVPPRPFREVQKSILKNLADSPWAASWSVGRNALVPLDAAFLEVEHVPLAAASIAQVHGAVLRDGTRVVIKVQHKGMDLLMRSDLRNLVWLAKFLRGQLPVDLLSIVKEIQSTIPLEFDFNREIWFMNSIRNSLEANGFDQIVCPYSYTEYCSKQLIVMERIDGIPFTKILHPLEAEGMHTRIPEAVRAVEHLIRAYGQMFLLDGVFHADPHAGNLFLLPDGRLGLLDFGQSKVIDGKLRRSLAKMFLALSDDNELAIALALLDLGMVFEPMDAMNVPLSTVAIAARILFDVCYVEEATVSPMSERSMFKGIPLKSFNQEIWMVVRTNLLLRGLCFRLKIDISAAKLWRPYAMKVLHSEESSQINMAVI